MNPCVPREVMADWICASLPVTLLQDENCGAQNADTKGWFNLGTSILRIPYRKTMLKAFPRWSPNLRGFLQYLKWVKTPAIWWVWCTFENSTWIHAVNEREHIEFPRTRTQQNAGPHLKLPSFIPFSTLFIPCNLVAGILGKKMQQIEYIIIMKRTPCKM